jgi:Lrp/AsnC family transcriptional regulator, leucine-responsive regulatory protein
MLIDKKELQIVSEFRRNARENLTTASRKLRIPVSTIYDRLKKYSGNLITRHTTLLDFKRLGFSLKVLMAFKTLKEFREPLQKFLETHHRVNSVFRVSNNSDYLIEVLFRDLRELQDFIEKLENFNVHERQDYYIVEDIKREEFLANPDMIEMIADN